MNESLACVFVQCLWKETTKKKSVVVVGVLSQAITTPVCHEIHRTSQLASLPANK